MKKFYLIILLFAVSGVVAAQSNSFLLYSFKGPVTVVENNSESPAKVGRLMTANSTIKIGQGGTVTLICNEAAMFTFGKTGSYALNKFGDSCRVNSSSFSSNYVKYVWAQMTTHEGSPGSNRKAFMNTVGAVSRNVNDIWIDPKLDTLNYYSGEFPLSWTCYSGATDFEVMLYTKDNLTAPFYSGFVSKKKIQITDLVSKIKPGTSYYWSAAVKGEENDDMKVLNYVTKDTYDAMIKKLKSQGPSSESPAEQNYRMGFMMEDAHYLADAYQFYAKAAALDSNNFMYRSTLMSFKKDYEIK